MDGAPGERILQRRVIRQPSLGIVPGGDCGACVLGGALGISVERVYDELQEKRHSISHGEMSRLLRVACMHDLADRCIDEPAEWRSSYTRLHGAFGHGAHLEAMPWFAYVRMAIEAGYYGIAQVDFARNAGEAKGGPDHWVLICGARYVSIPPAKVPGAYHTEHKILVSCSAGNVDGEWVEAWDFLRHRGGYNLLFVRPT